MCHCHMLHSLYTEIIFLQRLKLVNPRFMTYNVLLLIRCHAVTLTSNPLTLNVYSVSTVT